MQSFYNRFLVLIASLLFTHSLSAFGLHTPGKPIHGGLYPSGSTMISYSFSVGRSLLHELRVDYFVHDRWSLFYSIGFSPRYTTFGSPINDSYTEMRLPLGATTGVAAGSVIFSASACGYYDSGFGEFLMLCCMIPDGVAYHIPFAEKFDLSPFINVSGISYQWNLISHQQQLVYSPMLGVRLLYPVGDWFTISAEQNVKRTAGGNVSASAGLGVSVVF